MRHPARHVTDVALPQIKHVKDFDLIAIKLKHNVTAADYLHIAKEDTNNVFAVGFQTTPLNSTGVPHILEHTTLCGSAKFPVRDPFFKMLNRSMSTFMNALTGSDVTMYPFSTENPADFNNLFQVYMDAVFHPLLRKLDFKQEGWRLEHEVPDDSTTPIVFKGVVYNEMKGVFSDVNNVFLTRLQQAMYPGTTYGYVSGGDPAHITDLSYEELIAFHKKYYHPSNAKFVTYGNFPLEPRLKAVDAIISPFGRIQTEAITNVTPLGAPIQVSSTCAPDPMGNADKQCKLSISYLTNDGADPFETFAMRMLATLLTDGASSPMYRALIETNIGSDYAASTGYDRTARMTNFSVGLQGIAKSDFSLVEEKIKQVFETVAKTGFESSRVDSAIHQLELGIRHRRGNFGMGLAQGAIQQWIHGGDPIDALEVTQYIARLRNELKTPGFFESRVEKYFLQNKHQVVFTMEPDQAFADSVQKEEESRLKRKIDALTPSDKEDIIADGLKLKQMQETKEDPSCLPTLKLSDVSVLGKTYPVVFSKDSDTIPIFNRETATNGISYISISKTLDGIAPDLLNYLSLYANSLTALGTKKTPSVPDLDEKIRRATSGISGSPSVQTLQSHGSVVGPSSSSSSSSSLNMSIGTSFLDTNADQAFALLQEILEGSDASDARQQEQNERLRTVIAGMAADGMNSLASSGHRYAVGLCSADLSEAGKTRQTLGGLEAVKFWNRVEGSGEEGVDVARRKIREINRFLLESVSPAKAMVISAKEAFGTNKLGVARLSKILAWDNTTQRGGHETKPAPFSPTFKNTFVPTPFTVNYTARAYVGVPYSHPDSPALQILAELMTSHFLHREVREKGGAYGGFSGFNVLDGLFTMASYRDPPGAIQRTFDAYHRGEAWGAEITKHVGARELDEAKLSILAGLDAPISAGQEGMTLFSTGLTDEQRQRRREVMIHTSLEQVQDAARKYLAGQRFSQAILGPEGEAAAVAGDPQWELTRMDGGGVI
ncbi:Presequence protease, mitochondrial [Entophlyctis sp. JEL0112]|nr:Presequence protease, mitochondrial [Entophlyctis sp. JEL0112]